MATPPASPAKNRKRHSRSKSMPAFAPPSTVCVELPSHYRNSDSHASEDSLHHTTALDTSHSFDSNDSQDVRNEARQMAHSFSDRFSNGSGDTAKRWGSCPAHYFNDEKQLQLRRESVETSVRKLYEARKDHIFEIFQDSWVISDPLEDEDLDCSMSFR